ncbi:MAG: DEAD/DEAH box helicase, partial [Planctomycetota bacterium]
MSFRTKEQDIKKLLTHKYIIGLNTTEKWSLKYESSNNKKIINDILKLKQSHYEYIREGAKVKPYIDYDGITKENKNEYLIDSQRKLLLLSEDVRQETLSKLLNIFIDSLNILGCNVDLTNILILDGSRIIYDTESKKRYYKISFHLTTTHNKFVFENTKHCKDVLLPILKETEYNLYNNNCFTKGDKPPIDKAVYGKTQKFRTIFSFKNHSNGEKDYILNPINNKCESITVKKPIKYFVQYFKSDYIIIETPLHLINNDMKQDNKHIEYKIKDNNNNNKQLTLNLNYSADIQRRLINKGIKTATINISKNGQYTNYNIMYNPNIDKCIYGNDHERVRRGASVCWAYIKSGCIYSRCFGAECKNKEPLKLGYVLENSPLENKQNCIQVNERFLTLDLNNKVNQECKKFIENDSYKALCIKSGTGTGKTYLLNSYIPLYEKIIKKKYKRDLRVLVISTRQSYARSVCNNSLKELNIINYLDYKEDKTRDYEKMGEVNKICVSIETLNHLLLTCRWKPYDVVILDESESISRHIFSETVKYGSYKAFQLLCKIIKRSKKVFVLDADLNKPSLRLINKIDKSQVLKINNTYINNKKEYYFSKNKKKFIQDIKDDLKNDKKLYIVVLSLTEAVFIEHELKATLTEHNKTLLPINSNSGGMTKRQLDNVNKHWIKYDIVITTSTTGAGVDFNPKDENGQTYKHFDKVYGFIQACCSPPTEFLQIIDRVRNPKSYKYNILIDSHINVPTDETFIYTYNQAEYITKQFKLTELTDTVSYSYLDNEE